MRKKRRQVFLLALFLVSAGVLGGCQKKYEQVSVKVGS